MKELIVLEDINPVVVFKDGGLDDVLKKIDEWTSSFVPDVTTAKGRSEIASIAHKIARSKSALDNKGKDYVAELKSLPKKIDAERKRAREYLDELKDRVRKPLDDYEAAEEARKLAIMVRIDAMRPDQSVLDAMDSAALQAFITDVMDTVIDESFEEMAPQARDVRETQVIFLEGLLAGKLKEEQDARDLERLRKEAEERERLERDERIRKEAEENARIAHEAEIERVKQQAEKDKQAAIQAEINRQNAADEQAERERLAAEQLEAKKQAELVAAKQAEAEIARANKEAAEKKANNRSRMATINNRLVSDLSDYCKDETFAKNLVTAIALGEIKNLVIMY